MFAILNRWFGTKQAAPAVIDQIDQQGLFRFPRAPAKEMAR